MPQIGSIAVSVRRGRIEHADIEAFAAKVQTMVQAKHTSTLAPPTISVMMGQRYARIVRKNYGDDRHSSSYAFVEIATGNIHKCDGWKRPAPQIRGNIFNENPLDCCTEFGIMYYR